MDTSASSTAPFVTLILIDVRLFISFSPQLSPITILRHHHHHRFPMTVANQNSAMNTRSNLRSGSIFTDEGKSKLLEEIETDQESTASSEDYMDYSPRSVARVRKWPLKIVATGVRVHSRILRIREEDSYLREEDQFASHLDVLIFSRPILPASPLSGKPFVKE